MDWLVGDDENGLRLDKFLAVRDRLGSRRRASEALERGKVFLNGVEAALGDASRSVAAGDRVRLWADRPGSAERPRLMRGGRRTGDLRIVFEDEALLVVDKPAGLLVVPLERRPDEATVYEQLEAYLRSRGKRRPLVVHRIDRDTSGLVIFAKTTVAQQALKSSFLSRRVERVYRAVVYGCPEPPSGTWRDRLVWDRKALVQKETHPRDPHGKAAVCHYQVLERYKAASLIEVRLVTGKRNQIRLQARLRGHTLVGEQRYVYGPDALRPIQFGRQALHAFQLAFDHPIERRPLRFEAALPTDLLALVERLKVT
jgi:23S rRNA pseudouridine1911/1915/1917 synthase